MRTFLQALRDVAESADVHASGGVARRLSSSRDALRELDAWLGLWKVEQDTIKVGILQSSSGVMAISERPLVVAAKLAIERVNRRGGVAGRMLEPVFKDGASSEAVFARKARELVDEGVMFIFGCWTSASRIEVLRVLNETGGLLFYPVQYEGYEQDEHAIYFGAAPNQQIIPAIEWCIDGPLQAKRFLSLGSDYIFPRVANEVIDAAFDSRDEGEAGLVAAPIYIPLEGYSLDEAIEEIKTHRPDVILNLLNGSANLDFFWRLFEISSEAYRPKVMSFSIGDHEVQRIGAEVMKGHYACWTYFCSIENVENTAFLRGMRNADVFFPSDPAEAAYSQMLVFANAAEAVLAQRGELSVGAVREALIGREFRSPAGACRVHENGHVAKTPRIGVIGKGARYDEVWSAPDRVEPDPYPYKQRTRSIAQLRKKLHNI
jgi:urea transport system substrate-binding protein